MLRKSQACSLCKQACHGDPLGFEPLRKRIQLIGGDRVAHTELWNLQGSDAGDVVYQ